MITAKIGKETINCYDGKYDRDTLKKWSKKKILKCPVCGEDYTYNHGKIKQPYFKHLNAECSLYGEPETDEHINGKKDLYEWIKCQEGVTEARLEGWLSDTKQRPDIMFKYNGQQYVIEYQCSPIATEYYERHELYQAVGIKDIWICGTKKYLQCYHKGYGKKRINTLEDKCRIYYNSDTKVFLSFRNRDDIPKVEPTFCEKIQDDGDLKLYNYRDKFNYVIFGISSAVLCDGEISFSRKRKELIQNFYNSYYINIYNQIKNIANNINLEKVYFDNVNLRESYIYIDVLSKETKEKVNSIKIELNKSKDSFYFSHYRYEVKYLSEHISKCFKNEDKNYERNLFTTRKNRFHNDLYEYFLKKSSEEKVKEIGYNNYYDHGYKFHIDETYYGIFIQSWKIDVCTVGKNDRWETLYSVTFHEDYLKYYNGLHDETEDIKTMLSTTAFYLEQTRKTNYKNWISYIQDYIDELKLTINTSKNQMWNISFEEDNNNFKIWCKLEFKMDLSDFNETEIIRKFPLTDDMHKTNIKYEILSAMRSIIEDPYYTYKDTNERLRILL